MTAGRQAWVVVCVVFVLGSVLVAAYLKSRSDRRQRIRDLVEEQRERGLDRDTACWMMAKDFCQLCMSDDLRCVNRVSRTCINGQPEARVPQRQIDDCMFDIAMGECRGEAPPDSCQF